MNNKVAFIIAFSLCCIIVKEHDLHDVNFLQYIDAAFVAQYMVSFMNVSIVLKENLYFLII